MFSNVPVMMCVLLCFACGKDKGAPLKQDLKEFEPELAKLQAIRALLPAPGSESENGACQRV